MGFFRRKETLNERLLREAGMEADAVSQAEPERDPEPVVPEPRYPGVPFFGGPPTFENPAVTGIARPRRWDVVTVARAPDLAGEEVSFVTLPDGTLIVDEEQGDTNLGPLADAVEQELPPPYRARGKRQSASLWAVSAQRIQVAQFEADGEVIELTQTADEKRLVVDGAPAFGTIPALERLGEAVGASYAIHAERLDADLWEVRVSAL